MHILHTVLHNFLKVLTRRICLTINSFFSWWSFPLSLSLYVWFKDDMVRRNSMLVTLKGSKGLKQNISAYGKKELKNWSPLLHSDSMYCLSFVSHRFNFENWLISSFHSITILLEHVLIMKRAIHIWDWEGLTFNSQKWITCNSSYNILTLSSKLVMRILRLIR